MLLICSSELSIWGDIANIVIAVASVATAIVTARMLIKQHKLQQEQLIAQQQEHQPKFYFKRCDNRLEICNKGVPLTQPIEFCICSILYIRTTLVENHLLQDYIHCCPIRMYADDCKCQEELDGIVAVCPFDKDERVAFHTVTKRVYDSLYNEVAPKTSRMTQIHVIESDLIKIKYTDIYSKQHTLYYHDSMQIDEDTYAYYQQICLHSNYKPRDIKECDVSMIIDDVLLFRFKKM